MKRNLLAIAIPALLVAAGANASIEVWNKDGNKVDFYGRVKAANHITDRGQDGEGDDTSARLGMSGQTQITDGITGYGRWEYEAKAGKNSNNEVRYAFAGLNFGDAGSFDYGRNDGVLKAITAYTDVLPEFGGEAANNTWNVLSARTKAVATYRNNNFFGLTDDLSFALQYADNGDNSYTVDGKRSSPLFDEDGDLSGYKGDSREAYGANVQWNIFDTGLTVGAGYAQTAGKSKYVEGGEVKKAKTWTTGIKYDNYNLYLAATYFQTKFNTWNEKGVDGERYDNPKIKGVELVAQYGIDLPVGRLTPSLAYVQHKFSNISSDDYWYDDEHKEGRNLAKYVSLGATYDLNKNFSAIVEYKFNLLKKQDIGAELNTSHESNGRHPFKPGTKDVLGVGLIYQF
ncbi:porin [Gilliamella sp. B14384H2]|uniref:porin n=1 Tax=unclassified Gilliamella TaxID=2685620 RepID=UPI0018DD044D|nr:MULTISPECIES: porin [unclassified Gilliamella]MBI0038456.1 porin [Gilliamella sp. B14384G10]MBI0040247.1 porin [Gilliamella sp. B14384G7]MBI0052087.1 porin [Gilliamella sp. B14384G13]MBI0054743.1 porin [Gilliamella sp. B14384H2]